LRYRFVVLLHTTTLLRTPFVTCSFVTLLFTAARHIVCANLRFRLFVPIHVTTRCCALPTFRCFTSRELPLHTRFVLRCRVRYALHTLPTFLSAAPCSRCATRGYARTLHATPARYAASSLLPPHRYLLLPAICLRHAHGSALWFTLTCLTRTQPPLLRYLPPLHLRLVYCPLLPHTTLPHAYACRLAAALLRTTLVHTCAHRAA